MTTTGLIEEFSFSNEDSLAGSCAGALRKVRSLAEIAPIGRLFSAITTLSETTAQVNQALSDNDLPRAAAHLTAYATPHSLAETTAPLPLHFKRRR
jgi:hypothetical protein